MAKNIPTKTPAPGGAADATGAEPGAAAGEKTDPADVSQGAADGTGQAEQKSPAPPGNTTGRTGQESSVHDRANAGPAAPGTADPELRTDGPTLAEFVAAGYDAKDYPPPGYAAREGDATDEAAPGGAADEGEEERPRTLLAILDRALKKQTMSHDDANRVVQVRQHLAELKGRLVSLELSTSPDIAAVLEQVEKAI